MTTGTNVVDRTTQMIKVTVPKQTYRLVRDAHMTAKSLDKNSRLATLAETVEDVQILRDAKNRYILAVDSKDLPKESGFYRVVRGNKVSFASISDNEAQIIRSEGRWDELLYVNQSAVNAAKESRPLALDVYYFRDEEGCLLADGCSGYDARVALVKLEPGQDEAKAAKPAAIEEFLRDADAAEKFIPELHERPATTAEIELLQLVLRRVKEQAK